MTTSARRWISGALALGWAALLFWESSKANPFPFVPKAILSHDKLLHMGAYGVFGALLLGVLARGRTGALGRAAALAVLLSAGYGATDEWHQSFVPGRDADPWDWAADAAGSIAGAAAMALILRRRDPRASIRA